MKETYGARTVKGVWKAILVAVNMLSDFAVAAHSGDVFTPYIEYSTNHYDNLLRLQDAAAALANLRDSQLSDTYDTVLGGMRFDQTWGRQHVTADLSANSNHYDHFSQFNYVGKDGTANWNWVLGNQLQGNLTSIYDQSSTPFQNDIIGIQTVRSIRTQRTNRADLAWLIHPSWRLRTTYNRYDLSYSAHDLGAGNRRYDTAELGVSYLARSGSNVGVVFRNNRGTYDGPQKIGGDLFNNNYVQKEVKLAVLWLMTDKSRLQFIGGPVKKKHEYFTSRDYSGFNAQLTITMQPTDKLSLNWSLWREIGTLNDFNYQYALTDGISIAPSITISSKFFLGGSATYQRLDYRGAQIVESLTPSNRRDTYLRAAADLIYRAGPSLSVTTTVSREVRDSNLVNNSYRATGISLKVRYEY